MLYQKPELKDVGSAFTLVLGLPPEQGDNVGDPITTRRVEELLAGLDD